LIFDGMAALKIAATLATPIRNFTKNLEGLREFVALVEAFLQKEAADYQKKRSVDLIPLAVALSAVGVEGFPQLNDDQNANLRKKFGAEFTVEPKDNGGVAINVSGKASQRFEEAIKGLSINSAHQVLLYRNCLISLVSSAEWFLSQVLRQFFVAFPEAAGVKEKTLTLEDLRRIGSIDEAESYLISLRVDEIMWGSLEDWMKFLRNTVKLSMGYFAADEEVLVEVFQRRNVMVHNDGTVHHSYLANVAESLRKDVQSGQKLDVTPEYLRSAVDTVERNFILIAAELWKKLAPKDEERANVLNDITMKALFSERYQVATGTSRFQMEDKQLQEKWLVYAKLNFWQSRKWADEFAEIQDQVEEADFTAKEDLIQLARYVLLDDFDSALPILKTTMQAGKLPLSNLEEWPIFKKFRMDDRVKQLMEAERAKARATVMLTSEEVEANSGSALKAVEEIEKQSIN
jgi:hypothetical protein